MRKRNDLGRCSETNSQYPPENNCDGILFNKLEGLTGISFSIKLQTGVHIVYCRNVPEDCLLSLFYDPAFQTDQVIVNTTNYMS